MVQRSLSFMVLAAGLVSCSGDPTESLRNGVDRLVADPSEIIVDSASSQLVLVQAFDEQGNAVQARFSATAGAGITVTFDSSFNRVFDANGKLKPQNPATRVRYIVESDVVGATSFTVTGGGKSTTVSVRVPPPAVAATISSLTPNPGDSIAITLPAPATFAFDPADTSSIGVTIGGNACKILTVTPDHTGLTCVPLPGSTGRPSLRNVLPGFGGLGPITVSATSTVSLPLPTLTLVPANPQAGDTVKIVPPAPFKFGNTGDDTSGVALSSALAILTVRTADSIKFLVGPGANTALTVNRLRIANFGGASNLFTLSAGTLTTPALPVLTANKTGTLAVGDEVTVTAPAKYRFTTASTVRMASTLPGINVGTLVTSVSTDSLTLKYVVGPNASNSVPSVVGVRLSGAVALGTFTVATSSSLTTPAVDQFPATLSTQNPTPTETVTITAGAGYQFLPNATVTTGTDIKRPAFIVSQNATSIAFLPIPLTGKSKPIVSGVVQTAFPTIPLTLPAAIYLTASSGTKTITPQGILDGASTNPDLTPFLPAPAPGGSLAVVDAGAYVASDFCDLVAVRCRMYRIRVDASQLTLSFRLRYAGPGDADGDGLEDGNRMDNSLYFLLPDFSDFADPAAPFDCDNFGGGAPGTPPVPRGVSGESCTQNFPAPGDYFIMVGLFPSATIAANAVDPFELRIDITNP